MPAGAQEVSSTLALPPDYPSDTLEDGEANLLDGNLTLNFNDTDDNAFVDKIVSARGVLPTGFSEGEDYWSRDANVTLDLVESGPVTLKLDGEMFDERAPDMNGVGGLNIGVVTDWKEKQSEKLGLDVGLFGDRLSYAGDVAWSHTADGSRLAGVEDGDSESGQGQWHRLDAKVLEDGAVTLAVYGQYSDVDSDYSSHSFTTGSLDASDGETIEFGGSLDFDMVSLSTKQSFVATATSETDTIEGTLGIGPMRFTYKHRDITSFDQDQPSAWTRRRRVDDAEVGLDLEGVGLRDTGEGAGLSYLVPSEVYVGGSLGRVAEADKSGGPEDMETGLGMGVAWYWDNADTSIDFWGSQYDSRAAGFEADDSMDWSLDLTQTAYGDGWNFSLYGSVNYFESREVGYDYGEMGIFGGASLALKPETLPDLYFSVNAINFDSEDSDYASTDQMAGLRMSMDMSKYVNEPGVDETSYLKMDYYGRGLTFEDSDDGDSEDLDHAVLLVFGTKL
jgi:hypothetical protein